MIAAALLLPVLLGTHPVPQGTDAATVVARYRVGDQERVVTRGDLALEMAFHLRRKDQGRAACTHLVDATLVRQSAREKRLWPAEQEVRARWNELQRQLRAAGRDPAQEPFVKNNGEAALLDAIAVSLAHDKLVRTELELGPQEPVSPDMLKLWTAEARRRMHVVDDPDQLPIGTAARVGETSLSFLDLGLLLVSTADQDEQDSHVRRIAVVAAIEAMAKERGIEVTPEELAQEIEVRRRSAESDPRFHGMTFEALLQSQGITPQWLLQSRVFRAQVLQHRLAAALHPKAELLREIEADRADVEARVGARRRLGVIYVRALDEPNQLVPRDFAAATEHLTKVRERLATEDFAVVARIASDDPASKARGGDLGWQQRRGGPLPDAVLDAAFALPLGEVSAPIRAADGCYLVKVLEIEPAPSDEVLCERLLERHVEELAQRLLREAKIVRADGTPLDGGEDGDKTGNGGNGEKAPR